MVKVFINSSFSDHTENVWEQIDTMLADIGDLFFGFVTFTP